MKRLSFARLLALGAGALDFTTGLGLVFVPALILPLMRVAVPTGEAMVYLRFVGAFVAAVGASYLWALARGGVARLRFVFEFTILCRIAAGLFCGVTIARGELAWNWLSVPATDFFLVTLQCWLLRQPIWNDDDARC